MNLICFSRQRPAAQQFRLALFVAVILNVWPGLVRSVDGLEKTVIYKNPVIPGDHPDPSVIRVGKEYWATATSSEWGPHFPILRSSDLVNWELVGPVFRKRPDWAAANFWAPEIAEYKGRYYIYYTARKRGGPLAVAVASADHPAGPYTDHGVLVAQEAGSIDAVPFNDEHGNRYLIWKEDGNSRRLPTIIWAQPLSEDGTKLFGDRKELIRNDAPWEGAVVEGPFFVRRGDWFYMFYSGSGCCGSGCNYALGVARSKSLLGPWEKNPANPILAGNEAWRCPGHGSIVTDEQGRYWLLYHAYSAKSTVFTGREALLDEIKFDANGWPTLNGGKGPSTAAASPGGVPQRQSLAFRDDFASSQLRPGWQWPQDNEPLVRVAPDNDGMLALSPQPGHAKDLIGGVLARSTLTGEYRASVEVDLASLKPGVAAGLAAFGDSANAVGLMVRDRKLTLWRRIKGKHETLTEADVPGTEKVHLRFVASDGYRFRFQASSNGKDYVPIGEMLEGKQLPPWDRSIRVALTAGGVEGAEARFDNLQIQPGTN